MDFWPWRFGIVTLSNRNPVKLRPTNEAVWVMVVAQYWQCRWASETRSSGKHRSMLHRQPKLPLRESPSLLAVRSFRDRGAGVLEALALCLALRQWQFLNQLTVDTLYFVKQRKGERNKQGQINFKPTATFFIYIKIIWAILLHFCFRGTKWICLEMLQVVGCLSEALYTSSWKWKTSVPPRWSLDWLQQLIRHQTS